MTPTPALDPDEPFATDWEAHQVAKRCVENLAGIELHTALVVRANIVNALAWQRGTLAAEYEATVRRQQAALDAVTELADEWSGYCPEGDWGSGDVIDAALADAGRHVLTKLRTALASPAPTEATP